MENLLNLAIDSVTCAVALYLTYRVMRLASVLRKNTNVYDFGSTQWWHWVNHVLATLACGVGSAGMSAVTIYHTIATSYEHETTETITNMFVAFVLLSMIILINHITAEETPGNLMEHYPRTVEGNFIEQRRQNRRKNLRS